jgi:high-affinity nickel-transport protein
LAKLTLPNLDAWSEGKELYFGAAVVLTVLMSYLAGKRLARTPLA